MMSTHSHSPPKQNYVTILAIYDDPMPQKGRKIGIDRDFQEASGSGSQLHIPVNISENGRQKIENHDPPVHLWNVKQQQKLDKAQQFNVTRKLNFGESNSIHCSAHLQGNEVDPKSMQTKSNNWVRNNARKSRISDTFLDAREKIENEQSKIERWHLSFDPVNYRFQRIILSADTQENPIGLEISAVPNPERPSHLLALEVRAIEERGRLAEDGRLRVGDQIVEINGTPCEQISFARARLHLRELQAVAEPSLSFFRRIIPPTKEPVQNSRRRSDHQQNALQKSNTSRIGHCVERRLTKEVDGFGFSYAGRLNAREEHLYYVKGLRRERGLLVGDRILKIDGVDLAQLSQSQVTAMLKCKQVGEAVTLLVSRTERTEEEEADEEEEEEDGDGKSCPKRELEQELAQQMAEGQQLLRLEIPLNETPGAGLGISVKAQRKAGTDSGLYIRSILHGSAAYKDGRLRINDRLVGIESVNLLKYSLNGEALNTFMHTLARLPQGKGTVKVYVGREKGADSRQMGNRWGSDSEMSQAEGFSRDTAARRSISEKRPLGHHKDPSNLRTYQRIVHQRQTSAPALSSVARSRRRRSLHEPAVISHPGQSGQEAGAGRHRPKSTFFLDGPPSTLHTPPSKGLFPPSSSPQRSLLPPSKSQPESLAFLSRSGTIPIQSGQKEGEGQRTMGKRRSSLGSGLLKLFGRSQSGRQGNSSFFGQARGGEGEEASSSGRRERPGEEQNWRGPPPPYSQPWARHCSPPQQQQSFPSTICPCPVLHHQPGPPSSSSSSPHWPASLRLPPAAAGHFPGPGVAEVPPWHCDAELGRHRRRPAQPHSPRTTTSRSMFGSRPGQMAMAPFLAISEPLPWESLVRHTEKGNIGRTEPSAVFYFDNSLISTTFSHP